MLWSYLKKKVRARKAKNKNELWEYVQEEWYKIPPEFCNKLVKNYRSRLQKVIDAKGLEPVIGMSPDDLTVIPNLSQIKFGPT